MIWYDYIVESVIENRNTLGHALLFYGGQGADDLAFGRFLAQSLLCETTGARRACGRCAACNWFTGGNHPDYREVLPAALESDEAGESDSEAGEARDKPGTKASREIVVNQIRELGDFLGIATHRNGLRVVLLYPADALNRSAANAVLKSLEEPPPNTLFVLIAHRLPALIPTLRSRCRKIALRIKDVALVEAWLEAKGIQGTAAYLAWAGDRPQPALAYSQGVLGETFTKLREQFAILPWDPYLMAEVCEALGRKTDEIDRLSAIEVIDILQRVMHDVVLWQATKRRRFTTGWPQLVEKLGAAALPEDVLEYQKSLESLRAIALHPLNQRLFLESVFVQSPYSMRP